MEPLKLFYPNNYLRYAQKLGLRQDFHWGLCGKKAWVPQAKVYCLKVSPAVRFLGLQSGKTFRVSKSQKTRLLFLKGLRKSEISKVVHKVQKLGFGGVAISGPPQKCEGPWCSSVNFVILPENLREVKSPEKCPLIRYVKTNNSALKSRHPKVPACHEVDLLLKKKSLSQVCQILHQALQ